MKTFLTYSLGCRTNQAEIEEISQKLTKKGFTLWSKTPKYPKSPNVILINTCVVTQKAERETRQAIRKLKKSYPKAFLAVLGCGVDAHQRLKINLPEADLLISNEEKPQAVNIILRAVVYKSDPLVPFNPLVPLDKYSSSGRKLIAIQTSCNQYCTFCIVPYLRGKLKSKPIHKIIKTLKHENNKTIKEVILTGINLSLYGKDLKPPTTLTKLLRKTLEETTIPRISLSSLTPEIITKEFISLYLKDWKNGHGRPACRQGRLSRYWHLAIQSGSAKILRKMGRKTDLKTLKKLLYLISAKGGSASGGKVRIPEFVFRADFLVGFPGETEKDFKLTLQLIKVLKISFSHVFPFSKRPGTTAYKMIEEGIWQDLPPEVKKERVRQVIAKTRRVRKQEARKLIGKVLPCLFLDQKKGYWQTLADNSWPVRVPINGTMEQWNNESIYQKLKGQILPVKITKTTTDYLLGEILSLLK